MSESTYDFIVAGGGLSGCHLARLLADAPSKPSVALLEAGDYGYLTTPQEHLAGRQAPYIRGKGLGGSSAINLQVYNLGSKEDYNLWAEIVGDESWAWKEVKERYKKIENFHPSPVVEGEEQYSAHQVEDHGYSGPIDVSLPVLREHGAKEFIQGAQNMGLAWNLDVNSGNPIGMSLAPMLHGPNHRSSSASSNLKDAPGNLTVVQHAKVDKVLFDGKKAIGVLLHDGQKIFANREIILTAGAIDTPKILILSGVGDATDLVALDIPVVHNLPGVGKNLQDHALASLFAEVAPGLSDRYFFEGNQEAVKAAREQWAKDGTGPATEWCSNFVIGFLKDEEVEKSSAFKKLDPRTQEYLKEDTNPAYKIMYYGGPTGAFLVSPADPKNGLLSITVGGMNPQSRGSVTLSSSDPSAPPLINPNYMSDAAGYDRQILILGLRKLLKMLDAPRLAKYFKRWVVAPASDSDEDLNAYIDASAAPIWHANGTTIMGKIDDGNACVDSDCKVYGLENLRIGDLSVCPLTTNNHTQTTAYLVAQTLSEKMIKELEL